MPGGGHDSDPRTGTDVSDGTALLQVIDGGTVELSDHRGVRLVKQVMG
jgi:hypothetical protein